MFEDEFNEYYLSYKNYLNKSIDDAMEDDIKEAFNDKDEIDQLLDELNLVNDYFDGAVSTNIKRLQERIETINNEEDESNAENLRGYIEQKTKDDAIINLKISNMFSSLRQ